MAGSSSSTRHIALAKTVAKFAAAWGLVALLERNELVVNAFLDAVKKLMTAVLGGGPSVAAAVGRACDVGFTVVGIGLYFTLFAATALAIVGGLWRMEARARVRAGRVDPLDWMRRLTREHSTATRALLALPSLAWMWLGGLAYVHRPVDPSTHDTDAFVYFAAPLLLSAWGMFAMARKGLRELTAPTTDGAAPPPRTDVADEEITFDAVAVTPRTLSLVTAFCLVALGVPIGILVALARARAPHVQPHLPAVPALTAYVAFVSAGAYAFRKASRISVGVDGVHIRGTARARFFAYRELDTARVEGTDLLLVRGDEAVLRLQLHGDDAARRDAILARITARIARAHDAQAAVAAQIVASATRDDLARAAAGAGDYRLASLTREQLWALVEGPETAGTERTAAATALVGGADDGERTRLRVAAELCAEPETRVALHEIAGDEGAEPRAAGVMRATR